MRKKRITKIFTLTAIFLLLVTFFSGEGEASNYKSQTITTTVEGDPVLARPGTYWYQLDDGTFKAETSTGDKYADWKGTRSNPYPADTLTRDNIDLRDYTLPSSFRDSSTGNYYSHSDLSRMYITGVEFYPETSYKGVDVYKYTDHHVTVVAETGYSYSASTGSQYGTSPSGYPKFYRGYFVPLTVNWSGEVEETKEIRVRQDSLIKVGDEIPFTAEIRTKKIGSSSFSSYVDVSSRTDTTWSSDRKAVATVSSTGVVTGHSEGTATITATWNNGTYDIYATATITVEQNNSFRVDPQYSLIQVDDTKQYDALYYIDGVGEQNRNNVSNWSIADTSIATISDDGLVTGVAEGITTITATLNEDGRTWKDTAEVEVVFGNSFRVNPKQATIEVDETQQYDALYSIPGIMEKNENDRSDWEISDTDIATISDDGLVTGVTGGTTTLRATLQSDGQTWTDTAEVTVTEAPVEEPPPTEEEPIEEEPPPTEEEPPPPPPEEEALNPPVADFYFNPKAPSTGMKINFRDTSYHPDGVPIVKWKWKIDERTVFAQHPSYTPSQIGSFYATLTVTDENGLSDSVSKPVDVIDPPIAIIDAPSTVKAGEPVSIDGSRSYDPGGGTIVKYKWSIPSTTDTVSGESGEVTFMEEGKVKIDLSVQNNSGLWGSDSHVITVLPPTPEADFLVGGHLKENRKVTIEDESSSPQAYPVDWSKSYYTITPLSGQSDTVIKHHGTLDKKYLETLFKKNGDYKIDQYIENTYGSSDTSTQTITIAVDEKPLAEFASAPVIYRDAANNLKATIEMTDNSYSEDDDTIQERVWMYRYDSKNQYRTSGDFETEDWIVVDSGNKSSIEIEVSEVGYYEVRHIVKEDFGQPTILDFITDADYRTKQSVSKVIKVDNQAPVIEWKTQ